MRWPRRTPPTIGPALGARGASHSPIGKEFDVDLQAPTETPVGNRAEARCQALTYRFGRERASAEREPVKLCSDDLAVEMSLQALVPRPPQRSLLFGDRRFNVGITVLNRRPMATYRKSFARAGNHVSVRPTWESHVGRTAPYRRGSPRTFACVETPYPPLRPMFASVMDGQDPPR